MSKSDATQTKVIECCEAAIKELIKEYTDRIRSAPRCGFYPNAGQCPVLLDVADYLDKLLEPHFGTFKESVLNKLTIDAADEKWGEGMGALMEGDMVHFKELYGEEFDE